MTESKLFAPSIQRCAGCRFCDQTQDAAFCRRHPPQVGYISDPYQQQRRIWPLVFRDRDWCGDFEPREVEQPAESE